MPAAFSSDTSRAIPSPALLPDGNSKVMVGGAVLTPDYARDIGADYYCKDAKASADLAKQLLG